MKHLKTFNKLFEFNERLKEARPGIFFIPDVESEYDGYKGYTFEENWNGWKCPSFEKEEADKILEDFNNESMLGDQGLYDEKLDVYKFSVNGEPIKGQSDEDLSIYEAKMTDTVDGKKKLYSIGSFEWTWEEKEEKKK